ncbi:MAG: RNA-binding transcriptional accessory protein [Syntrophomonadaceae bacterium]|nr:RNA-binding transcriptional accessory protein [Syntrophomonadaceae bacterium]
MDKIIESIAAESGIPIQKVASTLALLDDDKTIPFIARYRKEVTGELDEVQIRRIDELQKLFRNLAQRKEEVLRHIEEQGQLTPDIQEKIRDARRLTEVEDIYRPFRPKRRTRASMARDKGLQGLADYILDCPPNGDPEREAENYLNESVDSTSAALQGARDIIAETVADDPGLRQTARAMTRRAGVLVSRARDKDQVSVYAMYNDYREPVNRMPSHRILAINRAEKEEIVKVAIEQDQDAMVQMMNRKYLKPGPAREQLSLAIIDAWQRLLAPAIERDIRNELTEKAQTQALEVFARNLRALLLQAPIKGKTILGIDPAYRTGCKWAVVDPTGLVLEIGVFYPTPPRSEIKATQAVLQRLVEKYQVDAIAIGNGTASRETEAVVASFIQQSDWPHLAYTIVSEAGASVYSASPLAAEEFPDLDVSERSAVSIGRRIQDPLAELVKIDPKSIGVGQYQHDLPAKQLEERLSGVVESAVNHVGVDLNTASPALLTHVAGINHTVAKNIVQYRADNGSYENRRQLLKVPKLGPKAFEQAAGFLRISGGANPLDATPIHPESYQLVQDLLQHLDADLRNPDDANLRTKLQSANLHQLSATLDAGLPTLRDIVEALLRPGRDPREDVPPPIFRQDVLSMEAIQAGMELEGVVRNVVDFGAFVDIGVKTDGLVHVSEMATHRVKHPLEVVSIGDIVKVTVLSIDRERHRIALTMKPQNQ